MTLAAAVPTDRLQVLHNLYLNKAVGFGPPKKAGEIVMSVFDAGIAFRTWSARNGLAASAAAAQVADVASDEGLVSNLVGQFAALEAPLIRAVNARRVSAVAANEADGTIIVYVNKAFTAAQQTQLPSEFGGYGIEYRQGVVGQVGGLPPSGVGSPSHYLHNGRITCGSSVGLGGSASAGTMGALVRVGGDLFGLSNNHVLGRCSYGEGGHPVLTPGNIDINAHFLVHPFCVGVYERCAPLMSGAPASVNVDSNLDAALMRIVDDSKVSAMQGQSFVTPAIVAPLTDGMVVQKVGRTTGHTHGVVTGKVAGYQPVAYSVPELGQAFTAFFKEAWIVEGVGGDSFSEPGDSGSLVVGTLPNGDLAGVGLVFAGGNSISFIVPLDLILQHFGATIDAVHGI